MTSTQEFMSQHLPAEQLAGFIAYEANISPQPNDNQQMYGWVAGWGFHDALNEQPPIFPQDPDYGKGYKLGQEYLKSID